MTNIISEHKRFFLSLSNVKQVLNEGVSSSILVDAIENQRYVYIYYKGDTTQSTGYRIIQPYVLGKTSKGELVLRAWQIEGGSDGFKGLSRPPRPDHERFTVHNKRKGKTETIPGWRFFLVDKITACYPTGNSFKMEETPPYYNGAGDEQMPGGVIKAVPKTYKPPDIEKEPAIAPEEKKKESGFKNELEKTYDLVKRVKKKSPAKTYLYLDRYNNIKTVSERGIKRIPEEKVLGNLRELYYEYVVPDKAKKDKFLERKKSESTKYKS